MIDVKLWGRKKAMKTPCRYSYLGEKNRNGGMWWVVLFMGVA